MTPWEARLKLLVHQIKIDIPGFEVVSKDKSGTQKFLGGLLKIIGNKRYMDGFWTTFYPRVYSPAGFDYQSAPERSFRVLAHEYVHLLDTGKNPAWFRLSYILPQIAALVALGAISAIWLGPWWLLFLAGIFFLLPIPAYFRMKWEMRGYAMSFAVEMWQRGSLDQRSKDRTLSHFTGANYYFMWPFKKGMKKRFAKWEADIHNGDALSIKPFFDVFKIVKLPDEKAIETAEKIP